MSSNGMKKLNNRIRKTNENIVKFPSKIVNKPNIKEASADSDKKNGGLMSDASLRGVDLNNVDEKEDLLKESGQKASSEVEKTRPHYKGEQSGVGTAPDPKDVSEHTVLERAKESSLYDDATEENPKELDITEAYDDNKNKKRQGRRKK